MLLTNQDNIKQSRVTMSLSQSEAEDLVEKLSYLLQHPEYHHDHVEDIDNGALLDLLVIQPDKLKSYSPALREHLLRLKSGG